ncbi:MAG: dTDP-4-dehydrorhamnose reductase [bacterium]
MNILITGANGILGTDLYTILAPKHDITRIDIDQADITIPGSISRFLGPTQFDLIIHSAAYTDVDGCELNPDKAFFVNGEGTKNIAEYAEYTSTVLMYISTDFVFDGQKAVPYLETDIPNPINIYGKSKLNGEKYVQEWLSDYYIVRTSWLFGPSVAKTITDKKPWKNFVDTIIAKAKPGETLRVVDDQFGSPTYSLDLAVAIEQLIETEQYGIYHISNSGICSWYQFANEILKIKGLDKIVKVDSINSEELERPTPRPKYTKLDNQKYETITGNKLRSWREAVTSYIKE